MAATSSVISKEIKELRDWRSDAEDGMLRDFPLYAQQVKLMGELYGEDQDGCELSQPMRLMIGLGMALMSARESAVEWCITRCLNHGVSRKQINEVIELALLNGGTFVVSNARFAYEVSKIRPKKS